jgi:superfamily II DNA or RNA helicase
VPFVGRENPQSRPERIVDLYNDLPRTKQAVKGLWLHQGQLLNAYAENFGETPDLALELPTGTGKTLPGLILCEWVRRVGARVAYACPTSRLARQVAATAHNEGIPAVVLVGSHHDWPTAEQHYRKDIHDWP